MRKIIVPLKNIFRMYVITYMKNIKILTFVDIFYKVNGIVF